MVLKHLFLFREGAGGMHQSVMTLSKACVPEALSADTHMT